jgi:hypothetical protein
MAETAEQPAADYSADYAHILTDLHALTREVAGLRAELSGMRADVDELLPAARRAAAMLDTPVTAYLAARREASSNGGDQRAGTRAGRGRGARAARRKLPHA